MGRMKRTSRTTSTESDEGPTTDRARSGQSDAATANARPQNHGEVTVEVEHLTIRAGDHLLLDDAAARFEAGQVTLIVGASGVGKSLLLRALAGLTGEPEEGIVASGDVKLGGKKLSPAARRRGIGVVFQNFALFDEFSPIDNVKLAHAHRSRRPPGSPDMPTVQELLNELRVPGHVRTAALSSGQRQRLAIARALAYDPNVILYDEPTSGLDAATGSEVARLIQSTHAAYPKTSIVVTHDYETLTPIADRVYLLDPVTHCLREIARKDWSRLRDLLALPPKEDGSQTTRQKPLTRITLPMKRLVKQVGGLLTATTKVAEQTLLTPVWLLPWWRSPMWALRFFVHYARLVAGPTAWIYIAITGVIIGFVTTHFTFRFLPFTHYTKPLLIEDLLTSMGFALYRILVPILATILVAARCGAAVASDVGAKSYGQQMDALRTMGIRPQFYLLTPILYSFLIGGPLLSLIGYAAASATSLVVFTATHAEYGPDFWHLHFHRRLFVPGESLFLGTGWLFAKLLLCSAGIGLIAYHQGRRPKYSSRDVSVGITSTVLWSTLFVLVVHFVFAFVEFE